MREACVLDLLLAQIIRALQTKRKDPIHPFEKRGQSKSNEGGNVALRRPRSWDEASASPDGASIVPKRQGRAVVDVKGFAVDFEVLGLGCGIQQGCGE